MNTREKPANFPQHHTLEHSVDQSSGPYSHLDLLTEIEDPQQFYTSRGFWREFLTVNPSVLPSGLVKSISSQMEEIRREVGFWRYTSVPGVKRNGKEGT